MGQKLVWIDMEMTGLDPDRDHILEVATIVTSADLEILAEGPVVAIHQPESVLLLMDEWNQRTHGQSGLVERVRASKISLHQAEQMTLAFLKQWVKENRSPICGNSISQDRRFMYRYMTELNAFLHYRCLDVSSINELMVRWRPDLIAGFTKKNQHKALADIHESIEELRYYRDHFFILLPGNE